MGFVIYQPTFGTIPLESLVRPVLEGGQQINYNYFAKICLANHFKTPASSNPIFILSRHILSRLQLHFWRQPIELAFAFVASAWI